MKTIKIGKYQISPEKFVSLSVKELKGMGADEKEILSIAKKINDISKFPKVEKKAEPKTEPKKEIKIKKSEKKDDE